VALTAPVPRPPHRFRDGKTAGCRSLVTLGLAPILSRLTGEADSRFVLSPTTPTDGFTRRRLRRARPPFTRPWPLFLERVCRAYSRPDVAYRLLQLRFDVRATKPELFDPRRDGGLDLLPFLSAPHALSLAEAVRRGEPRSVQPLQPRCRFLLLAQVCPTAMLLRMPHLLDLRRGV
jgi:hypothetical protein